jgi:hypothetical protein
VIPLFVAVLTASLLGSVHCAGMCGPFVAFAVGLGDRARVGRAALHVAYHGGRLATYCLLGAAAGALGAALDLGGRMAGWQRAAAVVAGGAMIGIGLVAALQAAGVRLASLPAPRMLSDFVARATRDASRLPPLPRALFTGLLTTLLPCGWLYAFAVTAAGTGSVWSGAATMAAFWLGTLPILVALGAGVQQLAGALGRKLPLITSLAIIAVGLFSVTQRLAMPAMAATGMHAAPPASIEQSAERAEKLVPESMPCCKHGG